VQTVLELVRVAVLALGALALYVVVVGAAAAGLVTLAKRTASARGGSGTGSGLDDLLGEPRPLSVPDPVAGPAEAEGAGLVPSWERDAAPPAGTPDRRGAAWGAVPDWVARDRQWAVAVVVLGTPALAERTRPFLDLTSRRVDWLGLRLAARTWPAHLQVLVDVAHDLADEHDVADHSPSTPVTVASLVRTLDRADLELVQTALDLRRGAYDAQAAQRGAPQP